jgi:G2/mitotic-specific cyclin 1/2
MTENGYTKDEILKGERIILQTLDFTVSSYCSPYSWVRRISKADDYDIQTRTLSKFLMEVTLLDHRFLRCKPSMVAAVGMYLARKMLNGTWVSTSRVGPGPLDSIRYRHPGSDACPELKADRVKPGRRLCLLLQLHRGATRPGRVAPVRASRGARL